MIQPPALTDESKSLHITSVEKKVQDSWTNFYHNIHWKAQLENSQPYWYISKTQLEKKKNSLLFRSSNLSKSILGSRSVEATAPERVWSLGHVLLAELQHSLDRSAMDLCVHSQNRNANWMTSIYDIVWYYYTNEPPNPPVVLVTGVYINFQSNRINLLKA